jgi:putative glycosyltransferase (TIGR04372 family)
MLFRKLRKFLKPKLKRYPHAIGLYDSISWLFTRSVLAKSAKRSLASAIDLAFPMWTAPRCRLAYRYAAEGNVQKAIAIADDVLARIPELYLDDDSFHRLGSIYYLQGRYRHACRLFEHIEKRRYDIARELQFDRLNLRFFTKDGFSAIGHLGMLDKYVKAEILGLIPRRTNVILGTPQEFSNPAYVSYWEKYFSRITNPRAISYLGPLSQSLREDLSVVRTDKGTQSFVEFGSDVQSRWEADGRGPLLKLTAEHRERGYRLLRELGIPEGAWFVGLHVRESKDRMRDVRDANITTYRLAIAEIAKRGGWVLRMGDRNMRPLPPPPNTIDYALSAKREDWMDVFVWAEGRFFIGTGSGPQMIPPTFGKPVAIANYGPIPTIVAGKDDILLPKHYWREKDSRYLTLAERMSHEYGFRESIEAFATMGIRVVDNAPEELRDLVIEMMDRLEGKYVPTEQERTLQRNFANLAAALRVYPVRLARAFMSKHPDLFSHGAIDL